MLSDVGVVVTACRVGGEERGRMTFLQGGPKSEVTPLAACILLRGIREGERREADGKGKRQKEGQRSGQKGEETEIPNDLLK